MRDSGTKHTRFIVNVQVLCVSTNMFVALICFFGAVSGAQIPNSMWLDGNLTWLSVAYSTCLRVSSFRFRWEVLPAHLHGER